TERIFTSQEGPSSPVVFIFIAFSNLLKGVRCIVSQRVSDSRMDNTKDMVIVIEDTSYKSMLIGNPCVIPAPRNKNQKNNDSKNIDAANCVLVR
ncbi:hypothetical protein BDR05DRAFT_968861, partial [Suillus weaverae]